MRDHDAHHGAWDLAVLCFLRERPMHPYEMQRLLLARHKDDVLPLKKGSLYHAIHRLVRSELIQIVETTRHGRRPERTTYRITARGQAALVRWLEELVAVPRRESSELMVALSFIIHLRPADAVARLRERAQRLEQEIRAREAAMKGAPAGLEPIHLIESEYFLAMRRAELRWVRAFAADVDSGDMTWNLEAILAAVAPRRRKAER